MRSISLAVVGLLLVMGLAGATEEDDKLRAAAKRTFGALAPVPEAALTQPDVTLGQALFWDPQLSADGKTACASCHQASDWGADRRRFSPDARGKNTARHSQTVFNAMLQPGLRWVSDRKSGAHQAEKSLTGSMGLAAAEDIVPLLKKGGYEPAFKAAFPKESTPVSPTNYAKAIEAYEATLVTPAPFDRFLNGDDQALTQTQKTGLQLFLSVGCADCHNGTVLGGRALKKFGVAKDYWTATKSDKPDAGLFEATKIDADKYKFRVAMLRNIAKTAPYFHDGAVADLEEAVQVMADVQLGHRLKKEDAAAIVAFLESLTGAVPKNYGPPKK